MYLAPPEPIRGGYDTLIYGFELEDGPVEFAGPLILRVFRESARPRDVRLGRRKRGPASHRPLHEADRRGPGASRVIHWPRSADKNG
jgi:hypothetical protein